VEHDGDMLPQAIVDSIASSFTEVGAKPAMHLYWVSTDDHDEDWFVFAKNSHDARGYFAWYEGYDYEDTAAELVATVPASAGLEGTEPQWPTEKEIVACGGEFLPYTPAGGADEDAQRKVLGVVTKAVRLGNRTFVAGDLVANAMGALSDVEPH
jgi:hypothetical protein